MDGTFNLVGTETRPRRPFLPLLQHWIRCRLRLWRLQQRRSRLRQVLDAALMLEDERMLRDIGADPRLALRHQWLANLMRHG